MCTIMLPFRTSILVPVIPILHKREPENSIPQESKSLVAIDKAVEANTVPDDSSALYFAGANNRCGRLYGFPEKTGVFEVVAYDVL